MFMILYNIDACLVDTTIILGNPHVNKTCIHNVPVLFTMKFSQYMIVYVYTCVTLVAMYMVAPV